MLLCVDHCILCDDTLVYICLLDQCLDVLVITKSVQFPQSSPRSHGNCSFLILSLVFTFMYIIAVFSLCIIVSVLSVYACLFSFPVCGMFLAFSLFTLSLFHFCCYIDCIYGAAWNNQRVHLVCCQCLFGFCQLILDIIFCRYVGRLYVSLCSCYCTACFGHPDSVTSIIFIIYLVSCYCSLYAWSTIFSQFCTVEFVGRNGIFLWASILAFLGLSLRAQ